MSAHPLSAAALFNLRGWAAVVTGGGTGLGLVAARALAANGAKVYITGRRSDVLEKSAAIHGSQEALGSSGGTIIPLRMDVTSKDSIEKAVQTIQQENNYLNVLLKNAGIGSGRAAAAASDGAEVYGKAMWEESIEDDFQSFVTAAFMPLLAKAKSSSTGVPGNVIHTASISGFTKWSQNSQYSYNCSKAAVIHLARMLACELSHENVQIRVNGISPGYFPTELTTNALNSQNESSWPQDAFEKEMKRVGAKASRPGTDQEFATAILVGPYGTYAYAASKAAVVHLMQNLAVELGPRHITVNCVAPGIIPSKMSGPLMARHGGLDAVAKQVPDQKLGSGEDIAGIMVFLSGRASRHMNGATLVLDGGSFLVKGCA